MLAEWRGGGGGTDVNESLFFFFNYNWMKINYSDEHVSITCLSAAGITTFSAHFVFFYFYILKVGGKQSLISEFWSLASYSSVCLRSPLKKGKKDILEIILSLCIDTKRKKTPCDTNETGQSILTAL